MQCLHIAENMTKCPLMSSKCPSTGGGHLSDTNCPTSVRLQEVSTYGRLKMQCLYVAKNMTKCPLMRSVHLREADTSQTPINCPTSVRLREVSTYGRLKMQCLHVAENMTKCPLTSCPSTGGRHLSDTNYPMSAHLWVVSA